MNPALPTPARHRLPALVLACAALLPCPGTAQGQSASSVDAWVPEPAVVARALELATQAAAALAPADARLQAEAGTLDPRLRLAACAQVDAYLPAGASAWGRTRIGLRCANGTSRWNVMLPVTVHAWAGALAPNAAQPAGSRLQADALTTAQADWSLAPLGALFRPNQRTELEGRVLARPLAAGQALRSEDLQPRRWFVAGETVQLRAKGSGFEIAIDAEALSPGVEGQPARVRTPTGRVLVATPVGERRAEVAL